MSHTHILAKPHSMIDENGTRKICPAGTPCSPTERQIKNMPDVFVSAGKATPAPKSVGASDKSVSAIRTLAASSNDIAELEALLADERHGRERKGAISALTDRIEALETA
jgi:hypothetical protein